MTTTELLNAAQFITDAEGNRKAVVVDLAVWQEIVAALEKLDTLAATGESEDIEQPFNNLSEQNKRMLALLRNPPDDDKDESWWDEFEQELRDNRLTFRREIDFD